MKKGGANYRFILLEDPANLASTLVEFNIRELGELTRYMVHMSLRGHPIIYDLCRRQGW